MRRVLKYDGSPIDVWGSGDQVRDFIYIEDCVDAIQKLMFTISDGSAVNLGTGIPTSFKDLVKTACKVVHGVDDVKINTLLDKPEGVFWRCADTKKMNAMGYTPTTPLEAGIRACCEFIKENEG